MEREPVKRLLKLIISLLFHLVYSSQNLLRQLVGRECPGTCVVLYYHSVPPEQRSKFARQMDYVIHLARPIRADFRGRLEPGIRFVAVTFDDGFQSFYDNALPELIARHIPSTIFVPTAYLGMRPEWVWDPTYADRNQIIMDIDQLKAIPRNYVSIGSHSLSHPHLTHLADADARKELTESREVLARILDRDISVFSFPFGSYNERLLELASAAGYERTFSNLPTLAFTKPGEFLTGRVWVTLEDTKLELALKVLGSYRWLPTAFQIKHRILAITKRLGRVFTVGAHGHFLGGPFSEL